MAVVKITDQQFQDEINAGLSLREIARKYNTAMVTLYKKRQKIKENGIKKPYEQSPERITMFDAFRGPVPIRMKPFNLKVGDIVTDSEPAIKNKLNKYEIIEIHDKFYTCRKISGSGHWTTSFLKVDYQIGQTGEKRLSAGARSGGDED